MTDSRCRPSWRCSAQLVLSRGNGRKVVDVLVAQRNGLPGLLLPRQCGLRSDGWIGCGGWVVPAVGGCDRLGVHGGARGAVTPYLDRLEGCHHCHVLMFEVVAVD